MRFTTSIIIAAASLATSVVADAASITAAIDLVSTDNLKLNTTLTSFDGSDPLTVITITAESLALLNSLDSATHIAKTSANLTIPDAIGLSQVIIGLSGDVTSTLANIQAKKPIFAAYLIQPAILLNLQLEKAASDKFADAVVEKVPAALLAIAKSLTVPIDDAFAAAISDYETFSL
jgi:hypothetical protein